jgi:hypothetical protein
MKTKRKSMFHSAVERRKRFKSKNAVVAREAFQMYSEAMFHSVVERRKRFKSKKAVVAREAFQMYSEAIDTPSRELYERRIEEGWDLESISPGFSVYKKLKEKTQCSTKHKETASVIQDREQQTTNSSISWYVQGMLLTFSLQISSYLCRPLSKEIRFNQFQCGKKTIMGSICGKNAHSYKHAHFINK